MTTTIKPIAMRCNQEQFEEIRELLEENGFSFADSVLYTGLPYLTNNYGSQEKLISATTSNNKNKFNKTIFEEWDKEVFLEYCGIETFPKKWYIKTCKEVGDWLDENSDMPFGNRILKGYASANYQYLNYPSLNNNHLCNSSSIEKNGYEEITLNQFKKHILKQDMDRTITVTQLLKIHEIACPTWKSKITNYLTRIDANQNIKLSHNEINEMFNAADSKQKLVLESIFGVQKPAIDYDKIKTGSVVMLAMSTSFCKGDINIKIPAKVVFYKTPHFISSDNTLYSKGSHSYYCTFEQEGRFIVFSARDKIDYISKVIEY